MEFDWVGLWVGLVCWSRVFTLMWVGLGWVSHLVGWVGLGWRNWTHGQLWFRCCRFVRVWSNLSS